MTRSKNEQYLIDNGVRIYNTADIKAGSLLARVDYDSKNLHVHYVKHEAKKTQNIKISYNYIDATVKRGTSDELDLVFLVNDGEELISGRGIQSGSVFKLTNTACDLYKYGPLTASLAIPKNSRIPLNGPNGALLPIVQWLNTNHLHQ